MFFRPRGRKGRGEAGLGEVSYSLTTAQIISRLTHRGSVEVERVLLQADGLEKTRVSESATESDGLSKA